ncbi:hypothetical protein NDU88_005402 [Pleurodeles waltl]|uniref:Uncharacterized protein n=1 Tax=Pleurodeles waltl TaxID=8319 RepID=A0AAV7NQ68_PLEWA|nr:hypothetical protein NDU88_005402 [Pleurodeles waltl]
MSNARQSPVQACTNFKTSLATANKISKVRMRSEKCPQAPIGLKNPTTPGPTCLATNHFRPPQQEPTTRRPRTSPTWSQDPRSGPPAAQEDHQVLGAPTRQSHHNQEGPLWQPPTTAADPADTQAGQDSPLQAALPSSRAPQGRKTPETGPQGPWGPRADRPPNQRPSTARRSLLQHASSSARPPVRAKRATAQQAWRRPSPPPLRRPPEPQAVAISGRAEAPPQPGLPARRERYYHHSVRITEMEALSPAAPHRVTATYV